MRASRQSGRLGDGRSALLAVFLLVQTAALSAPAAAGANSPGGTGHTGRPVPGSTADSKVAGGTQGGIDPDAIVEKVRHTMNQAAVRGLEVEDRLYLARFGPTGFSLTLRKPSSESFHSGAGFELSTRGVHIGGLDYRVSATPWRPVENRAERSVAPGVVERVTAGDGHLEWDFVIQAPPAGGGDVRIEAGVAGPIEARAVADRAAGSRPSPTTWRWALDDGRAVRMGELVVLDAGGRELHRALPSVDGNTVSLAIPASALSRARYPVTVDPVVSPEYPVSEPVYGAASGFQSNPAVAFDGTNYFVVWVDHRAGSNTASDIYGARVTPAGNVLGLVPIARAFRDQRAPAIAFDGANYLVVWEDWHTASTTSVDIYGARVSPAGLVLEPGGVPISTAREDQRAPAVASNGADFLVVWEDRRAFQASATDIYGARVSAGGDVLDPTGVRMSPVPGQVDSLECLVLGPCHRRFESDPAVASDGAQYLVVWTSGDVYGTRVSAGGSVLDPTGIPISIGVEPAYGPAVASDGESFLVVWEDHRTDEVDSRSRSVTGPDIYGAKVSLAGQVLDPVGIPISTAGGEQRSPVIASGADGYVVIWEDRRTGEATGTDIYGARVSPEGLVLDPVGIPVSTADREQSGLAVAFGSRLHRWDTEAFSRYLVVWGDRRSWATGPDIYGTRVDPGGEMLDPAGILISMAANEQYAPAVAFDGANYLVVWSELRSLAAGSDIYGARVSPAGAVLDTTGIVIAAGSGWESSPAIGFDGKDYLVVWEDSRTSSTTGSDIYGARVSPAGQVLDPSGIPIAAAPSQQSFPAVASDGAGYLVVWSDSRPGSTGQDIYGARVDPAGQVLDPSGIPIAAAPSQQWFPAVASDGAGYLVVWEDWRTISQTGPDIYGAQVDATGQVLDPPGIPIATAPSQQWFPAVASDGSNYFVVWEDSRASSTTGSDIYGARVDPVGNLLDGEGLVIAEATTDEYQPNLVSAPGGFAVSYSRFAAEPHLAARRAFLRML